MYAHKSFACHICGKMFSQKHHVTNHIRTHTGEKPFPCDICEKTFSRRSCLAVHLKIHTDEKPYGCDICKKTFSQSINLAKHTIIHKDERAYKCDICKMNFARKENLTNHKRIHTGEKPNNCHICEKTFTQSSGLSKHKRTHKHYINVASIMEELNVEGSVEDPLNFQQNQAFHFSGLNDDIICSDSKTPIRIIVEDSDQNNKHELNNLLDYVEFQHWDEEGNDIKEEIIEENIDAPLTIENSNASEDMKEEGDHDPHPIHQEIENRKVCDNIKEE